jgi:sec-independent protein translocase protein TatA
MSFLSSPEIIAVVILIIVLFGGAKIPELARAVGRSMGEFKRGQVEVEKEIQTAKSQVSSPSQSMDDLALTRAQRMAKNLNIDIKGKSDEQLLSEIEKKLGEQEAVAKK